MDLVIMFYVFVFLRQKKSIFFVFSGTFQRQKEIEEEEEDDRGSGDKKQMTWTDFLNEE